MINNSYMINGFIKEHLFLIKFTTFEVLIKGFIDKSDKPI